MKLWGSFIEALESLSANKLRSSLTILGIVIGVAAVIAMISIGRGAQNSITGSIQGIGSNLLLVFGGGSEDVRNPKPITLSDADAISDHFLAPSVESVAPVLQGSGKVSFGGESAVTQVSGLTPAYGSVRNIRVAEGEFITDEHMLGQALIIPGVSEMLEALGQRFPMAVVSTRSQPTTLDFLESSHLTRFFSVIVTGQTCARTKPHPMPVLWAAAQMGSPPEACLMVGDTTVDIRAGRAAGAQTAGVLCGFGMQAELLRAGADVILKSTPELTNYLL